ncbi:S41 family peptidase [Daejeonella oryzae]|uniref:S41 family peptidase n=1 Tax=Daejeonella oryzae TaxID=1122943 RepID=UPI00047A6932|nr:S41 family peptidase [Daejeonella oryzae]
MRALTKRNLLIAAGYSAVLIVGMIAGPKFANENANTKNGSFLQFGINDRSDKVNKVLQIINEKYVDPIKIDTIQDKVIEEIVKNLDPHTSYLPPADAKLLSEDLEGNFYGIGIEYYILNDTLLVTSVNKSGPAYKAGMFPGDKILKVNNKQVAGIGISAKQVVENIRGKAGTKVNILLKRRNVLKNIAVLRDKITISSIDAAYQISKNTGYIKISKFGDQTDEDFLSSLIKLQNAGMKNLILDLRQNGGGYLNSATELADQFLGNKKLIVYTEGAHEPRTDYFATAGGKFEQGKLVVLIDENTASASEIVAGAVQDLGRGTIIGRRSFGKGLVQEQFNFGDGSALNLTIARYYTPLGRSIQKSYVKGKEEYYKEVGKRFKNGEIYSDGKGLSDTSYSKQQTYTTQSGKVVYGGGGIMPDIYVPLDTLGYSNYYYSISAKGILNDFVFQHLLNKKGDLINPEVYMKSFKLSPADYQEISQMALAQKIGPSPRQMELSKKLIETDVKALLARYYLGDEGFYKVLNAEDRIITRSLDVLQQAD